MYMRALMDVHCSTIMPGRDREKYYPKALLTKLSQDLKLQTTPSGKARKIINNSSVLASWRALAAKENNKTREKNRRISEHNEKLQLDDSLTDEVKFKRSKKEYPDILGKGGKAFCSTFKYEFGFKKRTSHQGKKERDFDDPLMEENRAEVASSVTLQCIFWLQKVHVCANAQMADNIACTSLLSR